MNSAPEREASSAFATRRWLLFPGFFVLMLLGFLYAHFADAPIRAEAEAFLEDLRRDRGSAAMARASAALRADFARGVSHHDNPTPNDTPAVVSETLRRSTGGSLGGDALGYDRRCFEGTLAGIAVPNTVYVEMVREDGAWRVDGVSVRRGFGLCDD